MDQEHAATALGIKASVKYGAEAKDNWQREADGWTVTLRYQRRRLTTPFFMGIGHNGAEPEADEVLSSLLSDASGYEAAGYDFDEWCAEYGYDTDSRSAEQTFRAVERQTVKLRRFLGEDYERALWDVES